MNYFAYGSNMSTTRLKRRVPGATPQGVARLVGYKLAWHKASKDGSGKCDIVQGTPDDCVYGVLYRINPAEKGKLDRAEGRGSGYEMTCVKVLDESSDKIHTAFTYYSTNIDPQRKSYTWYKDHVLSGAREHQLPAAYIRMIESVEAIEDPDKKRERKERQPGNPAIVRLSR